MATGRTRSAYVASPLPDVEEKPLAAPILVAIGAILVILEGWITIEIGQQLEQYTFGFLGGDYVTSGTILAFVGLLMFGMAFLIRHEPHHHRANGYLVYILVFVSYLIGLGGFYIGGLLATAGASLAVAWKPKPVKGPTSIVR